MRPLLSAFCDGEVGTDEAATLREHLRACAGCRATLRAYRAAPQAAAALLPALPASRSLFGRAHDALADLAARLGGGGGGGSDSSLSQVAATGGTRGAGMAALAKLAAICVGTAGGAAACMATGVVPAPLALERDQSPTPTLERGADPDLAAEWSAATEPEPATTPEPEPEPEPAATKKAAEPEPTVEPTVAPAEAEPAPEYAPPPEPAVVTAPPVASAPASSSSGSPAGEFGP